MTYIFLIQCHVSTTTSSAGVRTDKRVRGCTAETIPNIALDNIIVPKLHLIYRIYSNKRRGAYLIFRATGAALIRGMRLFKHCRQIYFSYIFIKQYTFYLLIFLWTDTKSRITREIHAVKKKPEFHDNESENIRVESELLSRCETIYNVQSVLKLF